MNTLIVYYSRYGATEKCANLIKNSLMGKAYIVNLKSLNSMIDLNKYDTILLGGGIYVGKLQPELREFISKNKDLLLNKNVGLFISCMDENSTIRYVKANIPDWLYEKLFVVKNLGYEINFDRMNFIERFMLKTIFRIKESYSKLNYDSIDEFAAKVYEIGGING